MSQNYDESSKPETWQKGLEEQKAIEELKKALGNLQAGYKCAGVHNGILKITFVSRAHQQEFIHKKEQILNEMRHIFKEKKLYRKITFNSVIAIYTSKPNVKQTQKRKNLELPYHERATGNFEITCDGKLGTLFRQIQDNIKKHTRHNPKGDNQ